MGAVANSSPAKAGLSAEECQGEGWLGPLSFCGD